MRVKSSAVNISLMKSPEFMPVATPPVAAPEEGRAPLPLAGISQDELRLSRRVQWAQALVLAALFASPAILCLRESCVNDPDVWWHLRAGEWILQHRAVPQTDPFSSFGAGKFWAAYSWLFEMLIWRLFQSLGLVGIVAYTAGMAVAITVVLHRLIRRLQADFTLAVLLTLAASYSLTRLYTPRPWLFTVLFFALELDLLIAARRTGKMRGLLWLPVIFALWANLHIQFIDGLVVLAIAWAEAVAACRWSAVQTRLRPGWLGCVSVACLLAPLANPYGWRIYQVAYDLASQSGVLDKVTELSAMPFRRLDDWCVLLLALAAVAVLARARRLEFFEILLLAFSILVSFRSQRDVWVVVIAASAILASGLKGEDQNRLRLTVSFAPLVAVLTGLAVLLGFCALRVNNAGLGAKLAESLPVRAVEVVKEKGWSGPLYNDYNWGGYLIWALRLPVSIDGRAALYGDERINRSVATWSGGPDWATDPDLRKAGVVIGPVGAPLTQLLRLDPSFELAYEDKLAAVFVARPASSSAAAASPRPPAAR
jgi:hypothetical protein